MSNIVHQLRLFFIALQFFTRLPIPRRVGFDPDWLCHASRYFPAVGIVVGAVTAGAFLLADLFWPRAVAVLISTVVGIWLTGAFHEDGFADSCDGLGGGFTRQRALEIMQDSRIGAYGAIGIGLMLALKCVTLSSMSSHIVAGALLLAHPLSRLAATALIWQLDYVKAEGKAKPLAQQMSTTEFLIAAMTVLVVTFALYVVDALPWRAIVVGVAATAIVTTWLAWKFVRRLGGYTGDCLGAVQQVAEAVFYLAILAVEG